MYILLFVRESLTTITTLETLLQEYYEANALEFLELFIRYNAQSI